MIHSFIMEEAQAKRVDSSDPVPGPPAPLWAWFPGPPACLSICRSEALASILLLVVHVTCLFITFGSPTSTPLPPPCFSQLLSHLPLNSSPPFSPLIPCLPLPRSSLSSPVRLCTEFFITSHLLPARAKDCCHQRRRQSDQLLTQREE